MFNLCGASRYSKDNAMKICDQLDAFVLVFNLWQHTEEGESKAWLKRVWQAIDRAIKDRT
jgi:hypothetical protein